MSGRGAADIEPELLRSEPGPLPGEFLESKDERLNGDVPPTPVGAQPTAAGQPKRGRFPVRRRTLKRQLGELQGELFSYERQFERAQADLQDLRGQLLERKRKLEQTERALEQEAAQRSAAQASLQAREETLTTARDHLAQLQAELPASERQRLELQAALEAACERINQLERGRTPQDSLLEADVGGEREGCPPADRPASEPRMTPLRAAARWRVERREGDQMLQTTYGDLLQLSISGERTAQLMQRLQRAAPQLQLLADALYPPS